jgi:plastocyanin domain-containing protein
MAATIQLAHGFNPTVKGGSHQRINKAFNIPKNKFVAVHKCPTSYRLVAQEHQADIEQLTKEFEAKLSVAVNERV